MGRIFPAKFESKWPPRAIKVNGHPLMVAGVYIVASIDSVASVTKPLTPQSIPSTQIRAW
ncbi:hypothetical protein XELAEV_18008831mg [Xenopus laevis]|uniref:Uncharacterized protein n=1 Tax=Xenopus laevis TaxID=8355 RepID=A0A974DRH9_XENLA|nr:hypothetical protein XELAEV_18008831mg [Xenopus laevis]